MVTTRLLHDLGELERLSPAWDDLADAVEAPLLARPFWCIPWARHMASGRPELAVVLEGTDLVGLTPTFARRLGPVELVRFLGHGLGTVSALVAHADDTASHDALWGTLLRGRCRFAQLLELRAPTGSRAGPSAFPHDATPRDVCPIIDCSMGLDTYWASRSKKLRENIRRAERTLATRGQHHAVEVVTTLDRWHAVGGEVAHVSALAEGANPRQDLVRGPMAAFTRDFIAGSADDGRLRLFIGRVDGTPVSFGVAFAAARTLSYWVTRFDPGFADASVGVLLMRAVVEHGFTEGFQRVDLLLGDQPHKRRWSTDAYSTLTMVAASNQVVLRLGAGALRAAALVRGQRHDTPGIAP